MNLTCSNKTIKYLMFVFNFLFVITGIIILAMGVSVKAYYYPYNAFLDDKYFSLPNMLIATGALIFLISFLGCYGAIRENWLMLMAFSLLLAIIFIFELSVGIAGYVLRDKTSNYLEAKLYATMEQYNTSLAINNMWDLIHEEFQCCGVQNMSDWYSVFKSYDLPISCCPMVSSVGVFYCNAYTTPATVTSAPTTEASTTASPPDSGNNNTDTAAFNAPATNAPSIQSGSLVKEGATTGEVPKDASLSTPTDASTLQTITLTTTDNSTTVMTEESSTATNTSTEPPTDAPISSTSQSPDDASSPSSSPIPTAAPTTTVTETPTNITTSTAYPPSSSSPYTTGCEAAFGSFLKAHAVDIGGVGIALAFIQLIGIFFAFHLARQLKNGYYST